MDEPKKYVLRVFCANEFFDDAPTAAEVTITREQAERIIALAKVVQENEVWCIEDWCYWPTYGFREWNEDDVETDTIRWEKDSQGDPFRTEADRMVVFEREVQWECYPKYVDNADLSTEQIKIKELAEHFGIPFTKRKE